MLKIKLKYQINKHEYLLIKAIATDVNSYGANNLKIDITGNEQYINSLDEFTMEDIEEKIIEELLLEKYHGSFGDV